MGLASTITTQDQNSRDSATRLHAVGRRQASATLMAGTALALSGYRAPARAQAVHLLAVDIAIVDEGYRASQLMGRAVDNEKNQKIGTLDDLVIAKDKSLYGILQVGGFLGLGGYLVAVPYDSLNISDDGRKITLAGASKEALGKLPEYQGKK
jgi:PRC-barrel domain